MDSRKIYAENPIVEQWRLISKFTYIDNITVFQSDLKISCTDEVKEFISGCLNQSYSYFNIADKASLDIKPPLVYYGAINLLAGVYALLTGKKPPVKTHGISVLEDSIKYLKGTRNISESIIRLNSPDNGAILFFHNNLTDINVMNLYSGSEWNIKELLSSIPDLYYDFRNVFPSSNIYLIPLQRMKTREGIIERIEKVNFKNEDQIFRDLKSVTNFEKVYLEPQVTKKYVILRQRMTSQIDLGIYSLPGGKFLQLPHTKNGQQNNTTQLIYLLMGLFFLGYLSRYKPEVWNNFIRTDATGEKYIFERLLDVAIRFFPNLVINLIYKSNIQFSNDLDSIGNVEESSVI